MEFLFDSANLTEIKKYMEYYPITGVTSNPSILKAEGQIKDIYAHFRAMRSLIGNDRTLHIQVISDDCDEMLAEAHSILKNVDASVYIKVPSNEQGFKVMRSLKAEGRNVTATAIYSKMQGFMAIACGADYIAPYCNRMEALDIDAFDAISAMREMIDDSNSNTKILAASFKNSAQVCSALLSGAHTVTVQPGLLHETFNMAAVKSAVEAFKSDWVNTQKMPGLPL